MDDDNFYQTFYHIMDNMINQQIERILFNEVLSESMDTYHDELLRRDENKQLSKKYETKHYKDEKCRNTKCFICMEDFEPDSKIIKIECSHGFHADCLCESVKYNDKCPMCKHCIDINHINK